MPKFTGTDLPQLNYKSDEVAVKKSILDLLDKINSVADAQYPVGYVYTQYPGTSDPATLFGGTWLNITSLYAGLFFRAEGGSSLAFNAGNQLDAFQGHGHQTSVSGAGSTDALNNTTSTGAAGASVVVSNATVYSSVSITNPNTLGSFGTPRTASETRPVNTTIRIWQRSGGTLTTTTGTSVTMGIYDSGTNSFGSWIRFTDGTMQCWAHIPLTSRTLTRATLVSGIGWYEITLPTITFPIPFISQPSITVGGYGTTGNIETIQPYNVTSTTMLYAYQYLGPDAGATATVSFESDWVATGKWK